MSTTSKNDQPIDHIKSRNGMIKVPIWRNVNADGKVSYSATPAESRYYDKKSEAYKSTTVIFVEDLLEASKLYDRVEDRCRVLMEADYQANKADGRQAA